MIELIVVILIMSILAAYAAPRFFGRGDFEQPAFAAELASALRYAQKLAVTSGCPVRFTIASTTTYQLWQPQNAPSGACDTTFSRAVLHPATGNPFTGTAPIGAVPVTLEFSARGTPSVGGTPLATNLVISLGTQAVVVTAGSGYVEVQ